MRKVKNKMQKQFWWVQHDWVKYKVPTWTGEVLIPHDYLKSNFVPNVKKLNFQYEEGKRDRREIPDFAGIDDSIFFVTKHAYGIFSNDFLRHGRSYEVDCSGKPHHLVLIDSIEYAIDLEKSIFERSGLNDDILQDISRPLEVVLKRGLNTEAAIFRLGGSFALNCILIVSDEFKNKYEDAGMRGLTFNPTVQEK